MGKKSVSVIIPVFNEAETVAEIIKEITGLYPEFEVIVINDGSTDETGARAKEAGALVYSHPYNIGNGAAIKSGIRIASGDRFSCSWTETDSMTRKISKRCWAFSRTMTWWWEPGPSGHQAPCGALLANKLYNGFASYVAKFPIQDLTSGFRAIKADIARSFYIFCPTPTPIPRPLRWGF